MKISIACGKIEQFIESIFPSQKPEDFMGPRSGELKTIKMLEKEAQEKEARKDVFYISMAMLAMFTVVAISMVYSSPPLHHPLVSFC